MTSRKKNIWVLVICVAVLAILIFFEPAYGWRLRLWLSPSPMVQGDDAAAILTAQNQVLQAQLAALQSVATELPQNPQGQIRAMVYLQYPFGFKSEMLINAGSNESVAVGKAVTFQGVFIGSIAQVFPDSAIVQTVFDPNFKMPVRVGSNGYDALLVGGADPEATSIAKTSAVQYGDIVYTAAPGFPYGLPVGIVNTTSTSPDNFFEQATVNFAYDAYDVQTVLIEQ